MVMTYGADPSLAVLAASTMVNGYETWACYVCDKAGVGPMPAGHGLSHGFIDGAGI